MKNKLGFITVVLIFLMYSFALNKERTKTKELTYKVTTQESTIDSLETVLNTYELENERLVNVEYDYVLEKSKIGHFWNAISGVESSFGVYKVGDNGNSLGLLQVGSRSVTDVNNYYNSNYTHQSMMDDSTCIEFASKYANLLSKHFYNKHNRLPTNLEVSRLWNGGYKGTSNELTLEYGNKFSNYLNDV